MYKSTLSLTSAFDIKVSSSVFTAYHMILEYEPLTVCTNELIHYSLITNVTMTHSTMELHVLHGTSYNVSQCINHF